MTGTGESSSEAYYKPLPQLDTINEDDNGYQEVIAKFLSLEDVQRRKQVFQEIQKAGTRVKIGDATQLKIDAHMRMVLDLSESDTEEREKFKTLPAFENFLAFRDLMVLLIQHEVSGENWNGVVSDTCNEIISLCLQLKSRSKRHLLCARWTAIAEGFQAPYNDLKIFTDTLDQITKPFNEGKQRPWRHFIKALKRKAKKRQEANAKINDEFWRASKALSRKLSKFIADILQQLFSNDPEENQKIEMIKSVFGLMKSLNEFAKLQQKNLNFIEVLDDDVSTAATALLNRIANTSLLGENEDYEMRYKVLKSTVTFTENYFTKVIQKYSELFESLSDHSYVENLYKIYDEKLEKIVKPILMDITQKLTHGAPATAVMSAIMLHDALKSFSKKGTDEFKLTDVKLKDYESWFPVAFIIVIKTPERISKAIDIEQSTQDYSDYHRSTSAADSMALVCSVQKFWEQFAIAGRKQNEVIAYIVSDLCRLALDYIDKYMQKIESEENDSHMSIPSRMTVALANFQYILEEMQVLMKIFIRTLVGIAPSHAEVVFREHFKAIDEKMNTTVANAFTRFKDVFVKWTLETAVSEKKFEDYLNDIESIRMMFKNSRWQVNRFNDVMNSFYGTIIESMPRVMELAIEDKEPQEFFTNLNKLWINLRVIFNLPAESDELRETIEQFEESVKVHSLDSTQLLCRHFRILEEAAADTPTATVNCYFRGESLIVDVMHAQKLDTLVKDANCHSFIHVKLVHGTTFEEFQSMKTKVVDTHSPIFDDSPFEFELEKDQKHLRSAAVYFRLKRKYPWGHIVLGEAFISFEDIPKLDIGNEKPPRRTIKFVRNNSSVDQYNSMAIIRRRGRANDRNTMRIIENIEMRELAPTTRLVRSSTRSFRESMRKGSDFVLNSLIRRNCMRP